MSGEAQNTNAPAVLTFEQAISLAMTNYPSIRAAAERTVAARAQVGLARTAYLPRFDTVWQSNRATRNNTFGMLFPQSYTPAISGPVLSNTSSAMVWGSATTGLLSWEPFDFGLRSANVAVARAAEQQSESQVALTRLDVAAAAGNAFLIAAANAERLQATRADVDRRQVFARAVHTLVDNQLRPGAEASRADAELAAARIQMAQAEAAERSSRAALAAALGVAGSDVRINTSALLTPPPVAAVATSQASTHPLAQSQRAAVEAARARERAAALSYAPRFNLQSAVSARGSGANPDGSVHGGLYGLGLQRTNWGVGLTVTFPLGDFPSIRQRKQIEAANERAEQANYDVALQEITAAISEAQAQLDGARAVAENTPVELQSARTAEAQARARYQAGLTNITEVADAQRLLVQAETDDAVARLGIWRALMRVAVAQGDLQPFLTILQQASGGH
jgi:outer membrane protein TolC